jgi:hypothetical protein
VLIDECHEEPVAKADGERCFGTDADSVRVALSTERTFFRRQ